VDVATVNVSVMMRLDGTTCRDLKIALGAVGSTPFRATAAEAVLKGQTFNDEPERLIAAAAQAASEESFPIGDIRGHADYRKKLVEQLVKQGIERTIAQSGS
jgi:carbon-monoxide dehydrogenase medium subunit